MKGKITAVLFIIVFILMVAVVCTFLTGWDRSDPASPSDTADPAGNADITLITPPAETASSTQEPSSTAPIVVVAPSDSTPPPVSTPAPTPTPATTIAPVQPSYSGTDLGSGSFRSSTGAKLDIQADWSAKTISSSQIEVTVTISLDSYSLHLQAVPNSVNVNLDGQYVSLNAPAVDYDGSALINTVLATKTFTVDLAEGQSDNLSLAVEWHFGGTYGDVELPSIECGGTISLSR